MHKTGPARSSGIQRILWLSYLFDRQMICSLLIWAYHCISLALHTLFPFRTPQFELKIRLYAKWWWKHIFVLNILIPRQSSPCKLVAGGLGSQIFWIFTITFHFKILKESVALWSFYMFGSYESTFYCWIPAFYGMNVSCILKKFLCFEIWCII